MNFGPFVEGYRLIPDVNTNSKAPDLVKKGDGPFVKGDETERYEENNRRAD